MWRSDMQISWRKHGLRRFGRECILLKMADRLLNTGYATFVGTTSNFVPKVKRGITCQSNFKLLMLPLRKLTHFKGDRN